MRRERAHEGLKGLMAQANDHLWDIRKQDRINMESLAKFKILEGANAPQMTQLTQNEHAWLCLNYASNASRANRQRGHIWAKWVMRLQKRCMGTRQEREHVLDKHATNREGARHKSSRTRKWLKWVGHGCQAYTVDNKATCISEV